MSRGNALKRMAPVGVDIESRTSSGAGSSQSLQQLGRTFRPFGKQMDFPPHVEILTGRQREIAVVVYTHGPITPKDIGPLLSNRITDWGIRKILGRLCQKGVILRRKLAGSAHPNGRRIPFVYLPAITNDYLRQDALRQLAQDHFEGSLLRVAQLADRLLNESRRE